MHMTSTAICRYTTCYISSYLFIVQYPCLHVSSSDRHYLAAASMDAPASTNKPGSQKPSCHLPFNSLYNSIPHRPATNRPHCMIGYAMDRPTCGSVVAIMEHMFPRFQHVPEAMPGRAASLGCSWGQGPCWMMTSSPVTKGAEMRTPAQRSKVEDGKFGSEDCMAQAVCVIAAQQLRGNGQQERCVASRWHTADCCAAAEYRLLGSRHT